MRFAELFAGAGGLSLGLEQAGHECVWHSEIEPHACAVLRHRWPDTPLYGDVAQLDGRELVAKHGPIDLLSGGSPCQDLSVAGKRAGLGGRRSGLFYEQARLWQETGAPLLLWENVLGALSSNGGDDFTLILEELSGTSCARPVGGWPTAGVIRGPDGRARVAYRVLDLQFFGPPQRRRRVFLLAVNENAIDRYDPAGILYSDVRHPDSDDRNPTGRHDVSQPKGNSRVSPPGRRYDAPEPPLGDDDECRCLACGIWWTPDGGLECCPMCGALQSWAPHICGTLSDGAHKGGGLNGQDVNTGRIIVHAGFPRRITPTECERLQGWPDGLTATGRKEDGRIYHLPDSARYKLIGNGVGSPCTRWIGRLLADWVAIREAA